MYQYAHARTLAWAGFASFIIIIIVGEAVHTIILHPIAFFGIWQTCLVVEVMISNYLLKTSWEAVMAPGTYKLVMFLMHRWGKDFFDCNMNLTPVTLET